MTKITEASSISFGLIGASIVGIISGVTFISSANSKADQALVRVTEGRASRERFESEMRASLDKTNEMISQIRADVAAIKTQIEARRR